jgi:ubiquinone/menaquinone biosynthesis C-methylase UbiE
MSVFEFPFLVFAGALNAFSNENDTTIMSLRCNEIVSHSSIYGHVLEIGSGTGINFACLHNNTRIIDYIGIEPNVHMHSYMEATIQRWNVPFQVELSSVSATAMTNVESNSIDTIIMTFVLCSIPAPFDEQLLIEAHRVLKPGGKFHLLEHVLSEPNVKPITNSLQKLIEP